MCVECIYGVDLVAVTVPNINHSVKSTGKDLLIIIREACLGQQLIIIIMVVMVVVIRRKWNSDVSAVSVAAIVIDRKPLQMKEVLTWLTALVCPSNLNSSTGASWISCSISLLCCSTRSASLVSFSNSSGRFLEVLIKSSEGTRPSVPGSEISREGVEDVGVFLWGLPRDPLFFFVLASPFIGLIYDLLCRLEGLPP